MHTALLLARTRLGERDAHGQPWSQHLGLAALTPVPMPVFIRISDLVPHLSPSRRDRSVLLDALAALHEHDDLGLDRDAWKALFERGEAMLLFDGLDEVADFDRREIVFDVFRNACQTWSSCPVVVTTRPLDTAPLTAMGFAKTTIEPFREPEIERFLGQWVAALYEKGSPDVLEGEAQDYLVQLREAIVRHARIRRLATNPVMLTCLAVVHWTEGRIPEGRSRVYRAMIRWLIRARHAICKELAPDPVERAFATLAFAMTAGENGKLASIDFAAAALAVLPALRRGVPTKTTSPSSPSPGPGSPSSAWAAASSRSCRAGGCGSGTSPSRSSCALSSSRGAPTTARGPPAGRSSSRTSRTPPGVRWSRSSRAASTRAASDRWMRCSNAPWPCAATSPR